MNSLFQTFIVNSDEDLQKNLMHFYHNLLLKPENSIHIKIHTTKWLSAASLNMLLIFIKSLELVQKDTNVYVELLDVDKIFNLLNDKERTVENLRYLENVSKKIIFYESLELYDALSSCGAKIKPSPLRLDKIKNYLKAFKRKRYYRYSSKILSLNPLIETEAEQHALTTRVKTLSNILMANLYRRINLEVSKEASVQIMFEVVKNIYQHSRVNMKDKTKAKGFACAQIISYPLIRSDDYSMTVIASGMESVRTRLKGKKWKILSITINDFGNGIVENVRKDLKSKLESAPGSFKAGRFTIDESKLADDAELLELAISTDYSSKPISIEQEEEWDTDNGPLKLSRKGYGFIYCLSFIAGWFGRMRIRSNAVVLDIFAKYEALQKYSFWQSADMITVCDKLQLHFDDWFEKKVRVLSDSEKKFPGTQILIEIPVEVFPN